MADPIQNYNNRHFVRKNGCIENGTFVDAFPVPK